MSFCNPGGFYLGGPSYTVRGVPNRFDQHIFEGEEDWVICECIMGPHLICSCDSDAIVWRHTVLICKNCHKPVPHSVLSVYRNLYLSNPREWRPIVWGDSIGIGFYSHFDFYCGTII